MLSLTLLVQVAVGGYSISEAVAPAPAPGSLGAGPPCGQIKGPPGPLIAFWVRYMNCQVVM